MCDMPETPFSERSNPEAWTPETTRSFPSRKLGYTMAEGGKSSRARSGLLSQPSRSIQSLDELVDRDPPLPADASGPDVNRNAKGGRGDSQSQRGERGRHRSAARNLVHGLLRRG